MAAAVTRCSRDLRYLWVNQGYADWVRRPVHEIIGHHIGEVVGAEAFAINEDIWPAKDRPDTEETSFLLFFLGGGWPYRLFWSAPIFVIFTQEVELFLWDVCSTCLAWGRRLPRTADGDKLR